MVLDHIIPKDLLVAYPFSRSTEPLISFPDKLQIRLDKPNL